MVIKFGGFAPNDIFSTIGRFKFGGMIRYCHMYMHAEINLADYNLAVERYIAKPPNFPALRYPDPACMCKL